MSSAEPLAGEGVAPSRAGVLELREVSKRYGKSPRPAVDQLSLVVPAGEVCVLIGPSGSGKTTALKMINRLIEPTSGEILIDGRSVRRRHPAELRREIGYVIQQVGLMPHLTVGANVATVPKLLGWHRDRIRARVQELLELVGLDPDEYAKRYPAELSGGQQQRVGLARALAGDPPVMLMDEPFSAVDPITRGRLQNDYLRLHRTVPKTVVFVTHDIDEAVKMGDRIALMRDGRLVQFATPGELLAHPANDFVADFVGADRALKSLSLTRLEELELVPPPLVRTGDRVSAVLERIERGELEPVGGTILVVDAQDHPLGWARVDGLGGDVVTDGTPGPLLDRLTTLRDALSALFEANALYGAVIDERGRVVGLFGVTEISQVFRREPVPAAADG